MRDGEDEGEGLGVLWFSWGVLFGWDKERKRRKIKEGVSIHVSCIRRIGTLEIMC